MENEKLLLAVQKKIISEDTYNNIITYRERLRSNNVPVIYNLRHLRKTFHIRHSEQNLFFGRERYNLYHEFPIPKKSGGERLIQAPEQRLKDIQKWIKEKILDSFTPSKYATGFRKGFSIVDNARLHVNKDLVINIDIKDFFNSVTYKEVYKLFSYIGYRNDVAHLLTKLCTNGQNVLPQGSPASPSISNLVLLNLDKRLSSLANRLNCNYSRYADDMTFSGECKIKSIIPLVKKIVEEEGFQINDQKIRLQYSNQRQEVTGIIVNKKPSVSYAIRHELENAIYFCRKYGVVNHMRHIKCDKLFYKEHLYGIAYFIKMVDAKKGLNYLQQLDEIIWN